MLFIQSAHSSSPNDYSLPARTGFDHFLHAPLKHYLHGHTPIDQAITYIDASKADMKDSFASSY